MVKLEPLTNNQKVIYRSVFCDFSKTHWYLNKDKTKEIQWKKEEVFLYVIKTVLDNLRSVSLSSDSQIPKWLKLLASHAGEIASFDSC